MWLTCICVIIYTYLADIRTAKVLSKKYEVKRTDENDDCWMTLDANEHIQTTEALEKKYEKVRQEFDEQQFMNKFDEKMLGNLLENQGAANYEVQKVANQKSRIPSGLNLGGHSMIRMPDSIMFFHRIKLRNDTVFRVNYLKNNFSTMSVVSRITLNDLHLVGNYERTQTSQDPSILQYTPTYGEVQVLLKDVLYKMEGRYRLQKDRLYLEMIISQLFIPDDGIILMYNNQTSSDLQRILQPKNIGDFLDRLKADLDLWLKDFFNEFLLDQPLTIAKKTFLQYDKERITVLNRYVDHALNSLKGRLQEISANMVKLPSFVIYSFNGMEVQLKDGYLSGLDTMYRRSMATNCLDKDVRIVDARIAFSSLKARYSYEVKLTTGIPALYGSLILSGDELSALMSISIVKEPLFVDLKFDFLRLLKPDSLTVQGSSGRIISTFKHILELHIIALMSNTMIDQVKQLSSLTKCVPTFLGYSTNSSGAKEQLRQLFAWSDSTHHIQLPEDSNE